MHQKWHQVPFFITIFTFLGVMEAHLMIMVIATPSLFIYINICAA